MGLHMGCTKMYQYAPKRSPLQDRPKSFEFVFSDEYSFAQEVHQNNKLSQRRSLQYNTISKAMVYFGAAHTLPHYPSMICSDFDPLLSVRLIQKLITLITQDNFETLCYLLLWWAFWCTLVHFGAPHGFPHDPSITCSDSYPLTNVQPIWNGSY